MTTLNNLLTSRRFLPLFITQILGALNDNILRSAIVIFINFRLVSDASAASYWNIIATAMFILPTLLFSSIAGELADKYKKVVIIRLVKFFEILIVLFTCSLLLSGHVTPVLLVGCIFLMGTHAAVFSPAKFAYLPEYLESDALLPANGLIEASTSAAIALGAAIGYLVSAEQTGTTNVVSIMLPIALIGWLSSLLIPSHKAQNPEQKLHFNFIVSTLRQIDLAASNRQIWLPILGIAWFWVVGMIYMANLANFVQFTLHYNAYVVGFLNTVFTIGIGVGSLFASKLSHGKLHTRFIPISLMGISITGLHLVAFSAPSHAHEGLGTLMQFCTDTSQYAVIIDFFIISFFSGLYVVPLYALLQKNSPIEQCAQIVAASNVISALMMICANIILFLLTVLGSSVAQLFFFTAIINLVLSMYLTKILPFSSIKPLLARFCKWFFKIEIQGLEHFQTSGKRLIIIANHVSFLDSVLLALLLPGEYTFAINTDIAKLYIVNLVRQFADTHEIDPTNPIRIKTLAKAILSGKRCIIFPEGRLTSTGGIMKVYEGTAALAQLSNADIIHIHLGGLRHSIFSRLKGIYKLKVRTKVNITIFPPFKLYNNPDLSSRENREQQVNQIYNKMTYGQYVGEPRLPLYQSLLDTAKNHGYQHHIAEDFSRTKLNYRSMILKTQILGHTLHGKTPGESNIGVLLPNTLACILTIFGLYAYRKVPTMLNYTGGSKNIGNSCITAQLKTVITSRQFISKAELSEELNSIKQHVDQVIFLEDLLKHVRLSDKIRGLWRTLNITSFYKKNQQLIPPIDSPAVILFTSGSEGAPKGVVLSHRNIVSNIKQSSAVMDLNPKDKIFNALPMFHAFGFNLGTITPVLSGIPIFLYPNPKHFSTVVELIYDTQATLLIGTNTFLAAYLKFSKSYDFSCLRAVFAGGEKLQDETRLAWLEQRGIQLLEGYGSTECGPVISCNTIMHNQANTVGKILPGIEVRYNPFPDLEIGGELCVRGENIMLGYLLIDNPGNIIPLPNGWYDTGDIVTYDEQGFISIVDRIKRFAKISGEMISLSAIENEISICWPEFHHGVISIPDPKRGEKLILITEKPDADRRELAKKLKAQGVSPLAVPNQIEVIHKIPLLSTGKVNYPQLLSFIKKSIHTTKSFLSRKSD